MSYGTHLTFQFVICGRVETDRRCFRHAVGDSHLGHVHLVNDLFHDFDGAGGTGHDTRTQGGKVEAVEFWMV